MNSRAVAVVYGDKLKKNFKILNDLSRRAIGKSFQGLVPMVKANAYGHGLTETAEILAPQNGFIAFGVATLDEALSLRNSGQRESVWIFSGISPFTAEAVDATLRFHFVPVFASLSDVDRAFRVAAKHAHFKFQLKWDTGMHRLGLPLDAVSGVERKLARFIAVYKRNPVVGICTHFAQSLAPHSRATRNQCERFQEVARAFARFNIPFTHASNSGAILSSDQCGTAKFCNIARPGIGLYGYLGKKGEVLGLRPALEWKTQVLHAKILKKGDLVGYDGTYLCRGREPQSILGLGYGDGFHRALSNKEILVATQGSKRVDRARIQGRVSMDLTSIDLKLKVGEWVTVFGKNLEQSQWLAAQAGTIEYEILTSVSARVPRIYK